MNSKLVKSFALIMLLSVNLTQATLYEVPNSFASVAEKVVATNPINPVEQASRFSWIFDGLRSGLTAAQTKGVELLNSTRTLITENPKTAAAVGGVAVTGAAGAIAYRSGLAGKVHSYFSNGFSYASETAQAKYNAMPTVSTRVKWATGGATAAFFAAGTVYLAYKNGFLDKALASASEYLSKVDTSVLPTVNVTMPSTEAIAQFAQEKAQNVAQIVAENKTAVTGAAASAATLAATSAVSKLTSAPLTREQKQLLDLLSRCRVLTTPEFSKLSQEAQNVEFDSMEKLARETGDDTVIALILGSVTRGIKGIIPAFKDNNVELFDKCLEDLVHLANIGICG